MSPEGTSDPGKPRRVPRKGLLFELLRFAGWLLTVSGLLLFGIAAIGFFIMLVRIGPAFIESVRYIDQQMGGFIFLMSLMYLLIFPVIGLAGAVTAGFGLALSYVATGPAASTSIINPNPVQKSQLKEPPTKRAG